MKNKFKNNIIILTLLFVLIFSNTVQAGFFGDILEGMTKVRNTGAIIKMATETFSTFPDLVKYTSQQVKYGVDKFIYNIGVKDDKPIHPINQTPPELNELATMVDGAGKFNYEQIQERVDKKSTEEMVNYIKENCKGNTQSKGCDKFNELVDTSAGFDTTEYKGNVAIDTGNGQYLFAEGVEAGQITKNTAAAAYNIYNMDEEDKEKVATIYNNVKNGKIGESLKSLGELETSEELLNWMKAQGWSDKKIDFYLNGKGRGKLMTELAKLRNIDPNAKAKELKMLYEAYNLPKGTPIPIPGKVTVKIKPVSHADGKVFVNKEVKYEITASTTSVILEWNGLGTTKKPVNITLINIKNDFGKCNKKFAGGSKSVTKTYVCTYPKSGKYKIKATAVDGIMIKGTDSYTEHVYAGFSNLTGEDPTQNSNDGAQYGEDTGDYQPDVYRLEERTNSEEVDLNEYKPGGLTNPNPNKENSNNNTTEQPTVMEQTGKILESVFGEGDSGGSTGGLFERLTNSGGNDGKTNKSTPKQSDMRGRMETRRKTMTPTTNNNSNSKNQNIITPEERQRRRQEERERKQYNLQKDSALSFAGNGRYNAEDPQSKKLWDQYSNFIYRDMLKELKTKPGELKFGDVLNHYVYNNTNSRLTPKVKQDVKRSFKTKSKIEAVLDLLLDPRVPIETKAYITIASKMNPDIINELRDWIPNNEKYTSPEVVKWLEKINYKIAIGKKGIIRDMKETESIVHGFVKTMQYNINFMPKN